MSRTARVFRNLSDAAVMVVAVVVLVLMVAVVVSVSIYGGWLCGIVVGPSMGRLWSWCFGDAVVRVIGRFDCPEPTRCVTRLRGF